MEAQSGKEAAVHIGGGGAEVTGRLTAEGRDIRWKYAIARIRRAWPEGAVVAPPADWREEVLMRRDFPVEVNPDGTFRATDIPPGDWRIDAMVFIERKGVERVHHAGDALKRFHIPAIAKDADGAPAINLGDVGAVFNHQLLAGELAPDFEAVTLDGKKLRLSDLRGKYVFIDFWATWCPPCRAEMHYVNESWEKLKNDRDVVILGLSLDANDTPVRLFVAEHAYGWTHAVMGEKSKVVHDYGITTIPCEWLVLPDGTLAKSSADKLSEQIASHRSAVRQSAPLSKQ
jgi:peroxiredoxin